MQVERGLAEDIARAFRDARPPAERADLLAAPYRSSEDAHELAAALHGRAWREVPVRELFRHREMLFALGPAAYRAYLPAYLAAALDGPAEYLPDLREYLIESLVAAPEASADRIATTRARLEALAADERAVAVRVIRQLAADGTLRRADEAVRALAAS